MPEYTNPLILGKPPAYRRPWMISLTYPVPSAPKTLIGTVCMPKPLIFNPSFKADIVVATWVPWESTPASESVGSLSIPSPSPLFSEGTKSYPPSVNADVVYAVEVVAGEPVSRTATATSLTLEPIAVKTLSRPICWSPHW